MPKIFPTTRGAHCAPIKSYRGRALTALEIPDAIIRSTPLSPWISGLSTLEVFDLLKLNLVYLKTYQMLLLLPHRLRPNEGGATTGRYVFFSPLYKLLYAYLREDLNILAYIVRLQFYLVQ